MMEHKAFVFDYEAFRRELRPILERALISNSDAGVVSFIEDNLRVLKDPYEGQPLGNDWRSLVEVKDINQYGDFALTKYYNPVSDIGIGHGWQEFQNLLSGNRHESPILGSVLQSGNNIFDPGKMGSYFQSAEKVRENREWLEKRSYSFMASALAAKQMLAQAENDRKGLYVTF